MLTILESSMADTSLTGAGSVWYRRRTNWITTTEATSVFKFSTDCGSTLDDSDGSHASRVFVSFHGPKTSTVIPVLAACGYGMYE